jgi:small conductance mechanosensitive channel
MRDFFEDIDWSRWSETVWTTGVRVIVVLLAVYIVLRIAQRLLGPAIRATVSKQMVGQPAGEVNKRIETLSHVANRTAAAIAVFAALITVLPEFGINAGALLAGAGIVGIAVGFGAQSLVRDILSGLFILIENQYGKGDVVTIAGVGGLVEDVNLRRTLLRDADGAVHSVPNGSIVVSSNLTRARSRVNIVISLSYEINVNRAFEVINGAGQELAQDPAWAADITEAPHVVGIENITGTSIDVRIQGETQPIRQWDVTRELRRRLKEALDAEGIALAGAP